MPELDRAAVGSRPSRDRARFELPEAEIHTLLPNYADGEAPIRRLRDAADPARFKTLLRSFGISPENRFFVPVCFGVRPDEARAYKGERYSEFSLVNLSIYRDLERHFREAGLGFEAFRTSHAVCMICALPREAREDDPERYILPPMGELEERYGIGLLAGLGLTADRPEDIPAACDSAEYAFHLYFFEPERIIDLREHPASRSYVMDEYMEAEDRVFRAILMQDKSVEQHLRNALDIIGRLHYGNKNAAKMHTMEFTGNLTARLKQYRLLDQDYFELQNLIQEQVLASVRFLDMRECVVRHFCAMLPRIYSNNRPKDKLVVEQIKDYIRNHYMEELSIRQLANVAYVSPGYFSHMFKTETGKNYKTFLTEIRMTHAVELLRDTELRVAEISEKVGYRHPRTFMDAFKQLYGTSPMDYRRLLHKSPGENPEEKND